MSIADIKKVKDAEASAAEIRKQAELDAAQLIADGKKEAKSLLEKAGKDADDFYKSKISEAEKQAGTKYDAIIEKEKLACEKLKENGRTKLSGVVDEIVRKVVND